jgi:DNA topoisomerase-1
VIWNKPVAEKCPECGYIGAEMKFTKTRGDFRKCLKCGNEWDVKAPEGEEAEAAGRVEHPKLTQSSLLGTHSP